MTQHIIFQAVRHTNIQHAKLIINSTQKTFTQILDSKSSTVLHICAYNNTYQLAYFFLSEYNKRMLEDFEHYNQDNKKKWLQKKDSEGHTCLHYAVYKNNYKIVQLLEQNGANIYERNSIGLSVMHLAAQGDSPLLLYHYLSKGFKLDIQDSKGSTPFHWACILGKQNAVNALISWKINLDQQDKLYGMTPLHLSVLSANGKIVKKLLISGANRYIKDYKGVSPLQKAKQYQYASITGMIEDKFGWQQFYNLKQPYRKTTKPSIPFLIFTFLYITTFLLNIIFVVANISKVQSILFIILTIIPLIFLILAGLSNPGRLKPKQDQKNRIFQIMLKYEASKICFECNIVKPLRSRHCDVCETCVMVYDHHCPWINNCVGAENYSYFFLYIITIQTTLVFMFIYSISILSQNVTWDNLDSFRKIMQLLTLFYTLINSIYAIPVGILIYFQCTNCLTNQTTLEKFGGQSQNSNSTNTSKNNSQSYELEQKLIEDKHNIEISMNVLTQRQSKARLSYQSLQKSYFKNCINMCFKNKNNLLYKLGR